MLRLEPPQTQGIGYHEYRTKAHSKSADHGVQLPCKGKIEYACRHRNTDDVVDKRPEQILLDVADNRLTKLDCRRHIQQIAFHQNNIR